MTTGYACEYMGVKGPSPGFRNLPIHCQYPMTEAPYNFYPVVLKVSRKPQSKQRVFPLGILKDFLKPSPNYTGT